MVTRFLPPPNMAIHARVFEPLGDFWCEKQVIDSQPCVPGKSIPKIIPEGVDALAWVDFAQRVYPPCSTICR